MKIAINGFGRIGRSFYRAFSQRRPDGLEIVAVNDLGDKEQLLTLLEYDSNYGRFAGASPARILQIAEPEKLPWRELEVDLVIESTGRFTKAEDAKAHLKAGANRVIISAPAEDADITIAPGVNSADYHPDRDAIISLGSCTTNALAPVVKILQDEFGIEKGLMTTVHAYTQDQMLQDAPHHDDCRRGRQAATNIVPTTTGAAQAIFRVCQGLGEKMDGLSLRVPVAVVSIVDLVCQLKNPPAGGGGKDKLNQVFTQYAAEKMKGILAVNDKPLVSSDFRGRPESSIVDLSWTYVIGDLVKVVAWYDNEWGYSNRLVDMCEIIKSKVKS